MNFVFDFILFYFILYDFLTSIPPSNLEAKNAIYPTGSKAYVVLKKLSQESPLLYQVPDHKNQNNGVIIEEKENEKEGEDSNKMSERKTIKDKYKIYVTAGKIISATEFTTKSFQTKFPQIDTFSNYMNFWSGKKQKYFGNRLFDELRLPYNPNEDKFTCKSLSPLLVESVLSPDFPHGKIIEMNVEDGHSRNSLEVNNDEEHLVSKFQNGLNLNLISLDPVIEINKLKENEQDSGKIIGRNSDEKETNNLKINSKKVSFFAESHEDEKLKWMDENRLKDMKKTKKIVSHDDFLKIQHEDYKAPRKRSISLDK